jgi:hypothetical protein
MRDSEPDDAPPHALGEPPHLPSPRPPARARGRGGARGWRREEAATELRPRLRAARPRHVVTAFFRVPASVAEEQGSGIQRAAHEVQPLVRVPRGQLPEVVAVSGSNYADVGAVIGPVENGERLVTGFAALDKLPKGGAGQAVQNLKLMLDVPETRTLEDVQKRSSAPLCSNAQRDSIASLLEVPGAGFVRD